MTNTSQLVSNANRIRTNVKPYAVGVGAVLALLLAVWLPPFLADTFYYAMPLSRSRATDYVGEVLQVFMSDLFKSLWSVGLMAAFGHYYDLHDSLRQRMSLVRTVAAGAGFMMAFIVGFQLLDTLTDALLGSLYQESVWLALVNVFDLGEPLTRLIAFGVALYTSLSSGHAVAGHRDTYLFTYLTVGVLAILDNFADHVLENVLYGEALGGVGPVLGIFIRDLLTSGLWLTIFAGTLGIVFAYGIDRFGVVDSVPTQEQVPVADGGKK